MQTLQRNGYTEEQVLKALQGLYGTRRIEFRYELLDSDHTLLRSLTNIQEGSVAYDGLKEIKGTASFTVVEDSENNINWLRHRIKPYVRLYMPPIPTEGSLNPATSYEEAVAQVKNKLAHWKFDDESTTQSDDIDNHPFLLETGAFPADGGYFNQAGLVEDSGKSIRVPGSDDPYNGTVYWYCENAGDFLNSRTALTFAGWFQSNTVGEDVVLLETTVAGSWSEYQSMTWDEINTLTWDEIEQSNAPGSGGNDTWDAIEASNQNWEDLGTWDDLLASTVTGLTITFNGANKSIVVKFFINSTEVTAETPLNTQTDQRTFFAFTWVSGGDLVLYVNGDEVTRVDSTVTGALENIGSLIVGGNSSGAFNGYVDDWLFTSSVATPNTLRTLYVMGAAVGPGASPSRRFVEWPQGVYLLNSPTRQIDASGVITRSVEAYDQGSVLDSQYTEDNYYVGAGALYTDAIKEILDNITGVPYYNITPSALTLPAQKVWDAGTSFLKILNDLTSAINYEDIHFDADGTAIIRPYIDPQSRSSEYDYSSGLTSVLTPDASQTLDLYNQPNKWILIVSEPDRPSIKSTYTNNDPASPTSTVNRGRTITSVQTEQDVADQDVLNAKVQQLAQEASQIYEELEFQTALMPMHSHRDVYHVGYPGLGIDDEYNEVSWSYALQAGASMKHTARRIINLEGV